MGGYDKKEVNEIMLDLWIQFSDFSPTAEGIDHRWTYGLGALESLESFLHENKLIDKHGIPKNLD